MASAGSVGRYYVASPRPAGPCRPSRGRRWGERGNRERGWGMSGSRPVSRVLSRAIIHLGRTSPYASSDLPGSLCEPQVRDRSPARFPIWSCSRWGLPCHRVLPPARCALTAPFHPYLPALRPTSAVYFLLHFPWARAPQVLPGTLLCGARTFLCKLRSDCLADSRSNYTRAASMQRAIIVCVQRQRASRFQQRVITATRDLHWRRSRCRTALQLHESQCSCASTACASGPADAGFCPVSTF